VSDKGGPVRLQNRSRRPDSNRGPFITREANAFLEVVCEAERAAEKVHPYDLRHSFASLLIHEGRPPIVEIAQQLGHNATTCLSTYAHVIAELRGAEKVSAQEQIRKARETDAAQMRPTSETGPQTHHRFGSTKGSPESDSNRRPLRYMAAWGLRLFAANRAFRPIRRFHRLRRTSACGCCRVLLPTRLPTWNGTYPPLALQRFRYYGA
jgi:hypothetical protein